MDEMQDEGRRPVDEVAAIIKWEPAAMAGAPWKHQCTVLEKNENRYMPTGQVDFRGTCPKFQGRVLAIFHTSKFNIIRGYFILCMGRKNHVFERFSDSDESSFPKHPYIEPYSKTGILHNWNLTSSRSLKNTKKNINTRTIYHKNVEILYRRVI